MNRVDVTKQLEEIVTSGDDFEWQSGQLTDEWENEPKSLEIIEAILQFMESHPEIEYGTPGSLIHFVEAFPNYKEKIIESVERKPTPHTVWMLDRVLTAEQDQRRREAIGDWLTALIGLASLAVLFRWKVNNPLLILATSVVGLIAFPLLQPTWMTLK
jgi:hypothetical protein